MEKSCLATCQKVYAHFLSMRTDCASACVCRGDSRRFMRCCSSEETFFLAGPKIRQRGLHADLMCFGPLERYHNINSRTQNDRGGQISYKHSAKKFSSSFFPRWTPAGRPAHERTAAGEKNGERWNKSAHYISSIDYNRSLLGMFNFFSVRVSELLFSASECAAPENGPISRLILFHKLRP